MSNRQRVPRALTRLRSATRAYLQILQDSVPDLDVIVDQVRATGAEDDWLTTLSAAMRTSLLDQETVGTLASIATALAHLLGEETER